MAQAVKRLFPAVRVAIGPAIEDGFYYDFAKSEPFTPEDLVKIEEVMREIAKAAYPFERQASFGNAVSRSRSRSSKGSTPRACRSTGRETSSTSAADRTCRRRRT